VSARSWNVFAGISRPALFGGTIGADRSGYGQIGDDDDDDTSPAHVETKIQSCLDQGVSTFDQADIYGGYSAEAILGAALKQNPSLRKQMEIVTKCDIAALMGRYSDKRV